MTTSSWDATWHFDFGDGAGPSEGLDLWRQRWQILAYRLNVAPNDPITNRYADAYLATYGVRRPPGADSPEDRELLAVLRARKAR